MSNKLKKLMAEGRSRLKKVPTEDGNIAPVSVIQDITAYTDFVVKDISPEMREGLQTLRNSNIKPYDIKFVVDFAENRGELLPLLKHIHRNDTDTLFKLLSDEKEFRALKLRMVNFINWLIDIEMFRTLCIFVRETFKKLRNSERL